MGLHYCEACCTYWLGNHGCPPAWEVWDTHGDPPEEHEICARTILATDPEAAAARYRETDPDDWEAGDVTEIAVRDEDGVLTLWSVERRVEYHYSARPLTERGEG